MSSSSGCASETRRRNSNSPRCLPGTRRFSWSILNGSGFSSAWPGLDRCHFRLRWRVELRPTADSKEKCFSPRLSRNRRSCGRICSQPSSRSNLVIASTLGSARRRASRSASRAQGSSAGTGCACACCVGATLGALSTAGAGCRGGSVVAMLSNRRCTWAFSRTQESSR